MSAPGSGPGLLGYRIAELEGERAFVESMARVRHSITDTKKELQGLTEASLKQDREMAHGGKRVMQQAMAGGPAARGGPGAGAKMLARGAGMAAGLAATVGGTMLVRESIRAGVQEAKDVAKLSIVVRGGAAALASLGDEIDALGRKTGIDDNLIAKAAAEAIEVGIAQADVMTLATAASRSAVVTQEDFADVMDATTNVLRTYNMEASQSDKVNSILFKGVRGGADSFKALGDLIGQRGSALQSMGLGLNDTVATVATLGQGGFRGMRAVGSVQTLLDSLTTPNKDALATAQQLGIAWDVNSVKAMGFGRWLDQVRDRLDKAAAGGKSAAESLAALGISGMAQSGFLSLINRSGEYNRILNDINAGHDTLGEALEKRSGQADVLANRLGVLKDQSLEAFGVGAIKSFMGINGGSGIDGMAAAIPKFTAAGEEMGAAARGLLEWLKDNGSTVKWGAGGVVALVATAWAAVKGKAIVDGVKGAATWATNTANPAIRNALGMGASEMVRDPLTGVYSQASNAGGWGARLGRGVLGGLVNGAAGGAMGQLVGMPEDALNNPWFAESRMGRERAERSKRDADIEARYGDLITRNWTDMLQGMADAIRTSFTPALLIDDVARRVDQMNEDALRKQDEQVLNVKIDHSLSIDRFGDPKYDKHGASAKVAGAGKADIHSAYKYSVVNHGRGVHEVLPMASNVVLGHIRRAP